MKILSCNSNRPLGEAIAAYLKVPLLPVSFHRFAEGEVSVNIQESVRGQDIFVIQPTSSPTNDTLMELLVTLDAVKRGAARLVTAVIPYYGYGGQDRKTSPRGPISAKLVANLLTVAGANHILAVDWHSAQIQGFFDIPTDTLTLASLFCQDIQARYGQGAVVVVSPDVGGMVRARVVAEHSVRDWNCLNFEINYGAFSYTSKTKVILKQSCRRLRGCLAVHYSFEKILFLPKFMHLFTVCEKRI
ncbi:MAG: prs [Alphaproteobacteria bacterium]|jgi:ribose-phosphate pyrophosphokinase|nr:prs [Alphaproteobacteria bacterium]